MFSVSTINDFVGAFNVTRWLRTQAVRLPVSTINDFVGALNVAQRVHVGVDVGVSTINDFVGALNLACT